MLRQVPLAAETADMVFCNGGPRRDDRVKPGSPYGAVRRPSSSDGKTLVELGALRSGRNKGINLRNKSLVTGQIDGAALTVV